MNCRMWGMKHSCTCHMCIAQGHVLYVPVRGEGVRVAPVAVEVVYEVHWDLDPRISPDRGSLQATVLQTHSRQSASTVYVTGV